LIGRRSEAVEIAASFRSQNPDYQTSAFTQLWLSRSDSTTYNAQIHPMVECIRTLGLAN
jgi:hypothetical protein